MVLVVVVVVVVVVKPAPRTATKEQPFVVSRVTKSKNSIDA